MTKDKKKVSKKRVIIHSIVLILLVVGISFLFIPLFNNLKFGLDLQGGFEILYKAESIDFVLNAHVKRGCDCAFFFISINVNILVVSSVCFILNSLPTKNEYLATLSECSYLVIP